MLLTAPSYPLYRELAERQLDEAMRPDIENPGRSWPEPGGPYEQLIRAERDARSLSYIGTCIPGVFADEFYIGAMYENSADQSFEARTLQERFDALRNARQAHLAVRLNNPSDRLRFSMVLPDDVLAPGSLIGRAAPDRIPYQAFLLNLAVRQGLNLRFASGPILRALMGGMNTSLIADRSTANRLVYREFDDREPHESAGNDDRSLREASQLEQVVYGLGHLLFTCEQTRKSLWAIMRPAIEGTPDLHNYLK